MGTNFFLLHFVSNQTELFLCTRESWYVKGNGFFETRIRKLTRDEASYLRGIGWKCKSIYEDHDFSICC